ncbi:TMEM175 family protein [soil metagenome]
MGAVREQYDRLFGRGVLTERLAFFSDAVFAIALTLLVIDLKVPDEYHGETSWDVIVGLLPGFLAFVISFCIIAINWIGHHRKFRVITAYDPGLIRLNFVLLFLVAFTPFPTSLMAEYPGEVASVVLYAAVVSLLSLAQLAMWVYAYRRGLMEKGVDAGVYRYVSRNLIVVPVVFGISILIAIFWDPTVAMYFWFVLIPANIVAGRVGA